MWSEIAFWPLLWVWLVIVVRNALVFIHLNEPQWCSARCFGTQLAMNICEDAPSWPCKLLSQMPPTQCKKLWNRWHDMRLSRLGNPWEDKPWLWAVGLHRSIPDVNQAQALSIPEQFCPPHHHRCHHLPAYDVGSKKTHERNMKNKKIPYSPERSPGPRHQPHQQHDLWSKPITICLEHQKVTGPSVTPARTCLCSHRAHGCLAPREPCTAQRQSIPRKAMWHETFTTVASCDYLAFVTCSGHCLTNLQWLWWLSCNLTKSRGEMPRSLCEPCKPCQGQSFLLGHVPPQGIPVTRLRPYQGDLKVIGSWHATLSPLRLSVFLPAALTLQPLPQNRQMKLKESRKAGTRTCATWHRAFNTTFCHDLYTCLSWLRQRSDQGCLRRHLPPQSNPKKKQRP